MIKLLYMKTFDTLFRKRRIHYSLHGSGPDLVLLHGFTESLDIWTDFAEALAPDFRVLCIDLPGHGSSECLDGIHTMEVMAEMVVHVLKEAGIQKCVLTGHSMGGYVSLAVAEKYPELLSGLCLFHSSALADDADAKARREQVIKVVKAHHHNFLAAFIPELFAEGNRKGCAGAIKQLLERAKKMSPESLVAALEGMRERKDRSAVLKKSAFPVLWILGKEDSRVDYRKAMEQAVLADDTLVLLMGGVGHMGYLEARNRTLHALRCFAESCEA
jgi:pimeloyl-ACP methyl ester carboxylesterase